ncbi:Glycoside hydrolase family 61 protein [Ceratobasidium theobromae]|uniref:AA9 family lytic polysaccharide monooxygenase n=1 Tax=Ceratobasidium theobromae TaxID=1582974 RepID=A0A5N5QAB9_9AGAM|nr:Glycoside hydrolase family 61 protein [Ceratobasidium theobromae]
MRFSTFASILAGAATVYGHIIVGSVYINGVSQGNGLGTYIRNPPNNSPVKELASPDIACNVRNVPVPKTLEVKSGDIITFELYHDNPLDDIIAKSHVGPVQVYVAPTASNGAGPVWVKIFSEGFTTQWATDKLIANKGHISVTVPDLVPNEYLFRPEVLALHEADTPHNKNPGRGVQLYMECVQFKVISSGSVALPAGIDFVTSYTYDDPGLVFDVYNGAMSRYVPPGGPVSSIAVANQPGIGPIPAPGSAKNPSGDAPPSNQPAASKPVSSPSTPAATPDSSGAKAKAAPVPASIPGSNNTPPSCKAPPSEPGYPNPPSQPSPVPTAPPAQTPLPLPTSKMMTITLKSSTPPPQPSPVPPPSQPAQHSNPAQPGNNKPVAVAPAGCSVNNIKVASAGDSGSGSGTNPSPPVAKYYQCGGINYTGSTTCVDGTSCKVWNPYYSQCL